MSLYGGGLWCCCTCQCVRRYYMSDSEIYLVSHINRKCNMATVSVAPLVRVVGALFALRAARSAPLERGERFVGALRDSGLGQVPCSSLAGCARGGSTPELVHSVFRFDVAPSSRSAVALVRIVAPWAVFLGHRELSAGVPLGAGLMALR